MEDSYDLFSSVYRELIESTGHIQKEKKLATRLLSKFNASSGSSILDGACGTGDLLFYLIQNGFVNVSGMDASNGMLNRAREVLPDKILHQYRLENVINWVQYKNNFDFILILSLSLLHIESTNLHKTFQGLLELLKPSGVLLFDNRNWLVTINNELIEQGRPIDIYRPISEIYCSNKQYIISDKCTYDSSRQIITYRIVEKSQHQNVIELDVSYMMKLNLEYIELLQNIGFIAGLHTESENWPYQIIYAIKS